LAIFQGASAYFFATYDFVTANNNVFQEAKFGDIEGVWTFMYFSYSSELRRAVAFISFGREG
jgi:hypothetical protein